MVRFEQARRRGEAAQESWLRMLDGYQADHPELAGIFKAYLSRELPAGWEQSLPVLEEKPVATRVASGKVLDALAPKLPTLVGGSADLTPSNNTLPKGARAVRQGDYSGGYLHFGVREHGMAAALNGLALHGLRPYGGTFLIFSDYMRPSIRLAAMMGLPVIYVFTHDSIGLGEDGPTHQPVEHLTALRAIPNLVVIRPADGRETVEAWAVALKRVDGPTALVLTRQDLPLVTPGEGSLSFDRYRLGGQPGIGGAGTALRPGGDGASGLDAQLGVIRRPAASVPGAGPTGRGASPGDRSRLHTGLAALPGTASRFCHWPGPLRSLSPL
jgi:transketolase